MEMNLERAKYSIVIHPSLEVRTILKKLKDILADKVGWYSSRNSEGHITIIEFEAFDSELKAAIDYVKSFCYSEKHFNVSFNKIVSSYSSKCVVVLPDKASGKGLNGLLQRFRKGFKGVNIIFGSSAHMSIGRKLKYEQIDLVENIFPEIDLNFKCDKIAVRKFSGEQYKVIYEFEFLNKPSADCQFLLFQ